ncbi:hypothetical protein [Reichenbachiella sp.]|uniref:hypothetical protein n=1 Tax=Reichenbachiella sp. TaxID=2184521 RepID=UPI003BAF2B1B
MKKLLIFTLSLFLFQTVTTAQDKPVSVYMSQFNVTPEDLEAGLKDANASFLFEARVHQIVGQDTTTQLGKFDPKLPVSEKWIILEHDGRAPTKKEYKTFYKNHNTKKDGINASIIADSWEIESEDENLLVVSFMYDEKSLPRKYHFLTDTKGHAHINKKANRLMHVIFKNDTPQKVKQFKVKSYELFMKYYFDTRDKIYLIEWEDLKMETTDGPMKELTEFFDYRKVK